MFREENRCFIAFQTDVFRVSLLACKIVGMPQCVRAPTVPEKRQPASCIIHASQ